MKKTQRICSLILAVVLMLGVVAMPASAASQPQLVWSESALEEENKSVSIKLQATGDLVYGSDYKFEVKTDPEGTQYLGVVIGTSGEAKGYVSLILSEKFQVLLKMITLPKMMSQTPDQEEDFNVYQYLKQLIDGNDVSVLLSIADEVVAVMDVLHFYIPQIDQVSEGMKLALELIRKYLPESMFSRMYLDEQPMDAGSYAAGAVALENGDVNSAGMAFFKIKPKSENVRLYWSEELPASMTLEQLEDADLDAVVESDGQIAENGKVTYTYKKKGCLFDRKIKGLPEKAGTYIQTATAAGNYSSESISRTITIEK